MNWINTKDKLPPKGKWVLVIESGEMMCDFHDGTDWDYHKNLNVTHWMNLPKPPKEGSFDDNGVLPSIISESEANGVCPICDNKGYFKDNQSIDKYINCNCTIEADER